MTLQPWQVLHLARGGRVPHGEERAVRCQQGEIFLDAIGSKRLHEFDRPAAIVRIPTRRVVGEVDRCGGEYAAEHGAGHPQVGEELHEPEIEIGEAAGENAQVPAAGEGFPWPPIEQLNAEAAESRARG